MSTILDAQQKNRSAQVGSPPPVIQTNNTQFKWKIVFSVGLLLIITLLSALIYLLLNPIKHETVVIPHVAEQTVLVPENTIQEASNEMVKVKFDTQPLAMISASPEKKTIQNKQAALSQSREITQEKQRVIPTQPKISQVIKKEQKIVSTQPVTQLPQEEVAVSEDLKKRFELALLLEQMEEEQPVQLESNDEQAITTTSDIHQMSSSFQNKVPLISYEAHVYSSNIADRWIRINGEKLSEGSVDSTGKLKLIEIQPQNSIFRLERQSFSLESLVDWKGY